MGWVREDLHPKKDNLERENVDGTYTTFDSQVVTTVRKREDVDGSRKAKRNWDSSTSSSSSASNDSGLSGNQKKFLETVSFRRN